MNTSASVRLRALAVDDPERVAIVTRDRSWTYAELDVAVEQVAGWLHSRRGIVGTSNIVTLRFRSTVRLIISSLALSRSGMVCALVDPLAPPARVRLMLGDLQTDAGPPLLVTDVEEDIDEQPGAVLFDELLATQSDADVPAPVPVSAELGLDDLQNIIYTSGSTGVPVGLRVSGRQRSAIDAWSRTFDAFREGVRIGVVAAGTLGQSAEFPRIVVATGATMVVHDVLVDGLNTIPRWLREERVEAVALVPTLIRFLLPLLESELGAGEVLPDLITVAVWGESSDWDDVARLAHYLPPSAVVHNAYASTETGMIAALSLTPQQIGPVGSRTGPLPAGEPLPGVAVRILDPDGQQVTDGQIGEIAVASPHLAQGHWRRPELTAAALIKDGEMIFWRTGDGGRLTAGGTLHVSGRLDDVVKVSGHRVALGELEQVAREQHGVASAVAVGRPDPQGATRLHLYVVTESDSLVDPRWLRARLARSLPPASLPDTVDILESLPVLGNGKADRSALPEPATEQTVAASDNAALIDQLAVLFARVLGLSQVGADDDFFDCGGDSLRAGRLVGSLHSELGHYVPTSLLLEAPTPAMLASALSASGAAIVVPIQTAGSGSPLFVVHGGAGDVLFARALAAHLDERPVYALQPPPLVGPTPFARSLQAIAGRYVEEISRVRPSGPYRLFGYSLGGIIAFEMATLLQDRGEEIELLALGDTLSPGTMDPVWREQQERHRQAQAELGLQGRARAKFAHRRDQVRRRLAGLPRRTTQWQAFLAGGEPGPEIRGDAYLHVYGRLAFEHRVRTQFRGELTLVLATGGDGPPDRGWSEHVDGTVRTVTIDTGHLDLVVEPALTELGHALMPPVRA